VVAVALLPEGAPTGAFFDGDGGKVHVIRVGFLGTARLVGLLRLLSRRARSHDRPRCLTSLCLSRAAAKY
jgi:hypothetical protein